MEASEVYITLSTSVGNAVVDSCWRRGALEEAGLEEAGEDAAVEVLGVAGAKVRIDWVERPAGRRAVVAAGRLVRRALRIHGAALGAHALAGGDVGEAARVALGAVVVRAAGIADLAGADAGAKFVQAV